MGRRVLVTGDRNWADRERLFAALDRLHAEESIVLLIEGCGTGADRMAGAHEPTLSDLSDGGWAWSRRVPGDHYPAQWDRYGRAAGPVRNQRMLDVARPDLVVAFHDDLSRSRGTADMIQRAYRAGVPVRAYRSAALDAAGIAAEVARA